MENLGIDIKLLIAQGVNFLVFFYLFKKFLAKPFLKFLNEEKDKEKEKMKLEEEINQKRQQWLKEREDKKKKLINEIEQLKKQMKQEIEEERKRIFIETKRQVKEMKERGESEIVARKKILEEEVKRKVSDKLFILIEAGFKDVLDIELEKKITERVIKNLKVN